MGLPGKVPLVEGTRMTIRDTFSDGPLGDGEAVPSERSATQEDAAPLKHRVNLLNWSTFLIICLLLVLMTVLVGFRNPHKYNDTISYAQYFELTTAGVRGLRFEPVFFWITLLASWLSHSVTVYLTLLYVIFNVLLYITFRRYISWAQANEETGNWVARDICLLGFTLVSSWYLTSATNGLRQGLALPCSYIALLLFQQRRWKGGILIMGLATGLHYSSALIFLFLPLLFVKPRTFYITFIAIALSYPLGVGKIIFQYLGGVLSLDTTALFYERGKAVDEYYGFNAQYYLYSVFMSLIFCSAVFFIRPAARENYMKIVRIYMLLLFPYFSFAFASFTNRYAMMAWLFIPIVESIGISLVDIPASVKILLGYALAFYGTILFTRVFWMYLI